MKKPHLFTTYYDALFFLALLPFINGLSFKSVVLFGLIAWFLFLLKNYGEEKLAIFYGKKIATPEELIIKSFYFDFENGLLTYTFLDDVTVTLKAPYYSELNSFAKGYLINDKYYYYEEFSNKFKQKVSQKTFESLIIEPDPDIYNLYKTKNSWNKDK